MKIIIDKAIPFVQGVFEPYADVEYREGLSFSKEDVRDASALLIRTRTRCNEALLAGSKVQHIATATIGFDHINTTYCFEQGITYSTAAGCNARAVLQWVGAVLVQRSLSEGWSPESRTLGVVGVGNVGKEVSRYAASWGFNVICCDPPRMEREGGDFVSFEELMERSDIVTFHTPLDPTTHHMLNAKTLQKTDSNTLIINSSRGEVIDTQALLEAGNPFVLDVWENEPTLNPEALQKALLATPHIAGYSLQGKANASTMAVRSIAHALSLPLTEWRSDAPSVEPKDISWEELKRTIGEKFDITSLSRYLKAHPEEFEHMRNNYNYRNEYF